MMKTYEARSRIGLKLKIKQEAGLSKVIHNTALDPPGIPHAGIHHPQQPGMGQQQLNGSLEKKSPIPAGNTGGNSGGGTAPCRLPLRKTYREINRDVSREHHRDINREHHREINREHHREMNREHHREMNREHREIRDNREHREMNRDLLRELPPEPREPPRSERRPVITALRREPGSAARVVRAGKGPPEEPSDGEDEEEEEDEDEDEDEDEEEEEGCGTWGGKRRRAEAEVDKASFSSDSPQDDSLSEHLQSAIDSILNLQQPRGAPGTAAPGTAAPGSAPPGSAPPGAAATPPFPGPLVPPPSHNGGLGAARTCTR